MPSGIKGTHRSNAILTASIFTPIATTRHRSHHPQAHSRSWYRWPRARSLQCPRHTPIAPAFVALRAGSQGYVRPQESAGGVQQPRHSRVNARFVVFTVRSSGTGKYVFQATGEFRRSRWLIEKLRDTGPSLSVNLHWKAYRASRIGRFSRLGRRENQIAESANTATAIHTTPLRFENMRN
jgi:hypothetical protein